MVGVFLVDMALVMVQPFTSDKARLGAAVDDAVQWSAGLITRDAAGKRYDGGDVRTGIRSSLEAPTQRFGMAALQSQEMLERQFQGHYTLNALHTAAAALSTLPGRKTLIYFSDAIALTDRVLPRLRDVIATANGGQVTIYSVDTGGLRVGSQDATTSSEIVGMGRAGLAVNADGGSSSNLKMMERNEDVLRRAPRVGLTMLSKPTGGFLIDSTNDLAAGVRRIDADRRIHYLLTYQPAKSELDGKWRTIDVKVARRDTTVQSRQGYVAVKSPGVLPVLVYEGSALAAIDQTPAPREHRHARRCLCVPPVPTAARRRTSRSSWRRRPRRSRSRPRARTIAPTSRCWHWCATATARPTHKTSQPYRLTGPSAERTKAMNGEVRFARTLPMSPGSYTAWGAVHDAPTGHAGVASWRVQVERRGDTGLGVSSLVLLSRLERLAPGTAVTGDPLVVGDRMITPNLGEFIHRQPGGKLGFYVTIVGADPGERVSGRLADCPGRRARAATGLPGHSGHIGAGRRPGRNPGPRAAATRWAAAAVVGAPPHGRAVRQDRRAHGLVQPARSARARHALAGTLESRPRTGH